MTNDPFERAAKREEIHEIKREVKKETLLKKAQGGSFRDFLKVFVTLVPPYALWALLRATNHAFEGARPQALIDFFFQSGFWFAAATVILLLALWGTAISWASGD